MLSSTQLTRVPSRNPHGAVPTPLPTSRDDIPQVFVFPPEEERTETPPWCCFDPADEPDSEYSDSEQDHHSEIQFIDVALEFMNDHGGDDANVAPIFSRASMDEAVEEVIAVRKAEKRSTSVLSFMSSRNDGEGRQHGARELPEDVVEVFKVRRSESKQEMGPAASRVKRSKTLKMPFQKALRSIKNVGRSSSSRKPPAKDISAAAVVTSGNVAKSLQEEIEPSIPRPRSTSPMLSRRASQRLSQMFSKRNHSNTDLTTASSEPIAHAFGSQSSPQLQNSPSSLVVDDLGVFISDHNKPEQPSSVSSQSSSRRFSVLDLHRVFAFSSSPPTPGEEAQDFTRPSQDTPSLPALSHEGSSAPSTPSLESAHSPSELVSHSASSKVHWRTSSEMQRSSADVPRDASFEMRLDSLHFDSLSFDPDEFDVSLALNGQRRT